MNANGSTFERVKNLLCFAACMFAIALGIACLEVSRIQAVLDALDYDIINTSGFFDFYKNVVGVDLSNYSNLFGKMDSVFLSDQSIEIQKQFFSIYNDYIDTFADKTQEMQKFIEKFSAMQNSKKFLGITSPDLHTSVGACGLAMLCLGIIGATLFLVTTLCCKNKSEDRVINSQDQLSHIRVLSFSYQENFPKYNAADYGCDIAKSNNDPAPRYEKYDNKWKQGNSNFESPPPYPGQSVRVEGGFFSVIGKRVKSVLLLDDDAIGERQHSGKSWVQHILGMKENSKNKVYEAGLD